MLKEAAIGCGRRKTIRVVDERGSVQQIPNPGLIGLSLYEPPRQAKQTTPLPTYTKNRITNAIDASETHRNPLPREAITFELTGYTATGPAGRYQASDFVAPSRSAGSMVAPLRRVALQRSFART